MTAPQVTRVSKADGAAIADAARCLGAGALIAFPTETVYGLGADATNGQAVARLYEVKGRPAFNPLIAHVVDLEAAQALGCFSADAAQLAEAFWPGPLTLVLPGGEGRLPDTLRGPEGGVAVRWTSHRGAAQIIQTLGSPITSTSANRPGQPSLMEAPAIERSFAPAVAEGTLLVLDAGRLSDSPPSTLIDCTGTAPRLVREGAIPRGRLASIVPALAG